MSVLRLRRLVRQPAQCPRASGLRRQGLRAGPTVEALEDRTALSGFSTFPYRTAIFFNLAADSAGNVFSTVNSLGRVVMVSPLGVTKEIETGFLDAGLSTGPDGAVWVSSSDPPGLWGRIAQDGSYRHGTPPTSLGTLAKAPAGLVGFLPSAFGNFDNGSEGSRGQLVGVTAGGALVTFDLPVPALSHDPKDVLSRPSYPFGGVSITAGKDGSVWFTDQYAIKRLSPDGSAVSFTLPQADEYPFDLTTGADGNLWFIVGDSHPLKVGNITYGATKIGRMTPDGTVTVFALPNKKADISTLIAGTDGNLWFTEALSEHIGKITPAGVVNEYQLPPDLNGPYLLATTPQGELWFTTSGVPVPITPDHPNSDFAVLGHITLSSLSSGTATPVTVTQGVVSGVRVASVHAPLGQTAHVVVDLGNGTTVPATLELQSDGSYSVLAPVAYHLAGTYPVTVRITNDDGVQSLIPSEVSVTAGPTQNYATQLYRDLLGRAPEADGLLYWATRLDTGTSRAQVVQGIQGSPEFRTKEVTQLYNDLLGRTPDSSGLGFFTGLLGGGTSALDVRSLILGSPEFRTHAGATDLAFLQGVSHQALGRDLGAGDLAFWSARLQGGETPSAVAAALLSSPEAQSRAVNDAYQTWLHRPADGSGLSYFVATLGRGNRPEDVVAGLLNSEEYFAKAS